MAEMFGLLKELTTSRTLEKVLVREEARHHITKHVNAISLVKMKKEESVENNEVVDKNVIGISELDMVEPIELVDKMEGMGDGTDDESAESMKEELTKWETKAEVSVEMPRSQPIGYYLKHEITEKLIEGLVDNHRLSLAVLHYSPLGIAEDVLIKIAGYVYPVDFVILNIGEDESKLFILGTPFLTTVKTEIRFDRGTITLKSGKNKINLFKISASPCKIENKLEDDIEPITSTNIVGRQILEWEERIKLHQDKEMELNQWRSKVFNDKLSIPVKEGSEVSDEGGVT
ncbi:zinc finger, CCHC-type containing protein [Tanacetum coccineum]|uniref:Zinc finger, CCHC-type containing protein n=1 Tax=Tanacetum coccineum TaxID=301880 RepID=A0ABQ5FRY2_9ASTR